MGGPRPDDSDRESVRSGEIYSMVESCTIHFDIHTYIYIPAEMKCKRRMTETHFRTILRHLRNGLA